jgi:hypothetical protein
MYSMRTLLWSGAVLVAIGCGPKSHSSDDAGTPIDARPAADASSGADASTGIDAGSDAAMDPDAGGTAATEVRSGSVAGGVKASSAHYKIVGTVSEGGASAASGSFQVRTGVAAESQP